MPEHAEADDQSKNNHADSDRTGDDQSANDRRRSPRFSCGGHAEIICLPSTGIVVPGTIRDLSLHGCWVETALPIDCGARAEVVLRVNAASFRALGEVRTIRGQSGSGVEFVRLSANGRDMLADLVTDLTRLQALMSKVKSDRRAVDAELFREELKGGRLDAFAFRERFRFLRRILPGEDAEREQTESAGADTSNEERLIVPVDLFG
jgi:PilZ domain